MKKKHFYEVDFVILQFCRTCPKGKNISCDKWGADHWKNGRIFYSVWEKPDDDWIEIIEPICMWRDNAQTLGLEIDEEDLEGSQQWPWC